MFHFGSKSQTNLAECHQDLQTIFNEVIKHIDCSILQGQRSEKEQNDLFHSGKSKLQYPNSKHNQSPSMAVDVAPYVNNSIPWNDSKYFYHFGGFVLAISEMLYTQGKTSHKIRWGGNWDGDMDLTNQSFFDLPHFELI